MQKELTINLSDETYQGLMKLVGEKNASQFIETVLRSHIFKSGKETIELLPFDEDRIYRIPNVHLADSSQTDLLEVEFVED